MEFRLRAETAGGLRERRQVGAGGPERRPPPNAEGER